MNLRFESLVNSVRCKTYTQNEYLRGIKVSTLNNVTDVQQE